MSLTSLIAIILGSPLVSTQLVIYCANNAYLELFERPQMVGNSTVAYTATDLKDLFDDKTESFCLHKGTAILYTEHNYNKDSDDGDSIWAYSNGYTCFDVDSNFRNRISSVKFDGANHAPKNSWLSLYQKEGFRGNFWTAYGDFYFTPYDDVVSSIIVHGLDTWTMYDQKNFTGAATCIYPKGNYLPGFYPLKSNLIGFGGRVRSGRMGCHVGQGQNIDLSIITDTSLRYLTGSYRSYP